MYSFRSAPRQYMKNFMVGTADALVGQTGLIRRLNNTVFYLPEQGFTIAKVGLERDITRSLHRASRCDASDNRQCGSGCRLHHHFA